MGFHHLLQQADLDKALSLCTGMRGKLRSRFIVLSDERVLPPPPVNTRGKRKTMDSDPDGASRRKVRVPTVIPGVSQMQEVSSVVPVSLVLNFPTLPPLPVLKTIPVSQPRQGYTTGANALPLSAHFQGNYQGPASAPLSVGAQSVSGASSFGTEDWASATSDETLIQ